MLVGCQTVHSQCKTRRTNPAAGSRDPKNTTNEPSRGVRRSQNTRNEPCAGSLDVKTRRNEPGRGRSQVPDCRFQGARDLKTRETNPGRGRSQGPDCAFPSKLNLKTRETNPTVVDCRVQIADSRVHEISKHARRTRGRAHRESAVNSWPGRGHHPIGGPNPASVAIRSLAGTVRSAMMLVFTAR